MQNNDFKRKTDLKERAYIYALNIIQFIDGLSKNDFSIQVISKQLLRRALPVSGQILLRHRQEAQKEILPIFSIMR
ncbi:MAG: hypothetical protein Q8O39_01800 [bacterium]|nr:hypothetical protein [bacterium]